MNIQLSQSTVYLLLTILLCYRQTNLYACPLPTSGSCNNCSVLRFLQLNSSVHVQPNVNLTVDMNLAESENRAHEFANSIDPGSDDYSFDTTNLPGNLRDCFDSESGSPCTHYIAINGNIPNCTWTYSCNYSANRFPQYMWWAQCAPPPRGYRAQKVYYTVPTLTLSTESSLDCLPFHDPRAVYKWSKERVPVACVCIRDTTS